jgi:hypothetical protein
LLRDPSNACRLEFWRSVFRNQEMLVLHLVRDVRESIQGLCDGWNYPFGFQTLPSDFPLHIVGYTDRSIGDDTIWKQSRLNFSVDRQLSRQIFEDRRPMTLVEVCSYQWRRAHEQILMDSIKLPLRRIVLPFSELRSDPLGIFKNVCNALGLEVSRSGITYAESFASRPVMTTVAGQKASHERWQCSPYASEICEIAAKPALKILIQKLLVSTFRL